MKIKKLMTGALSCIMLTCTFTACGDKDDDKKSSVNKNDYMSCAEDFFENAYSKDGAEAYYTYILLDEVIESLKEDDKWDDMVESRNDNMEDTLEDISVKVTDISETGQLSEKSLKKARKALIAQSYNFSGAGEFKDHALDVKSGYEIKVTVKIKEDGDSRTTSEKFCIINADGESCWKILQSDVDNLDWFADQYDREMNNYE